MNNDLAERVEYINDDLDRRISQCNKMINWYSLPHIECEILFKSYLQLIIDLTTEIERLEKDNERLRERIDFLELNR